MRSLKCLFGRHLWGSWYLVRPKTGAAHYKRRCLQEACKISQEVSVREALFLNPKRYKVPYNEWPEEVRGTEEDD